MDYHRDKQKVHLLMRAIAITILFSCVIATTYAAGDDSTNQSAYLTFEDNCLPLKGHLSLLVDDEKEITIDDILKPEINKKFLPIKGNLSAGFSNSVFWLKATVLKESGPEVWIFEVGPYAIDKVDVYLADKFGGYRKKSGGSLSSFSQREFPNGKLSFSYCPEEEKYKDIYIRIESEQPILANPFFWQPSSFKQMAKSEKTFLIVYVVIALFILLINIFLWARDKKNLNGYFVLYSVALTSFFLNSEGLLHQYVFPEYGWLSTKIARIDAAILIVLGATLLNNMLNLKTHMPKTAFFLFRIAVFFGISNIVMTVIGVRYIPGLMTCLGVNLGVLLTLIISARLTIKGIPISKIYLLAFIVVFVAFTLKVLIALGFIPGSRPLDNIFNFSTLLHLMLMNFGITNRVELLNREKNDLLRSLNETQKTVQLQNTFLQRMSHEIRNPLAIISTAAQTLPYMKDQPNEMIAMAEAMNRASLRLVKLITNSMVSHEMVEKGMTPDLRDHNISLILDSSVKHIKNLYDEFTIHTKFQGLPQSFTCDGLMIGAMIENLLDNAIKYSGESRDVYLNSWVKNEILYVEVVDMGIGIPIETQKNIYDIYYRSNQVTGIPGTGLGLYLVAQIVKIHNGSIKCLSRPGETKFTLEIPTKL